MAGIIPAAGASNSTGRFRRRRHVPIADINVTPMVDVMLVLLVIFMVTAPLMMVGVPVQLPKTSAAKVSQTTRPVVVSINREGKVFLREEEIAVFSWAVAARTRSAKISGILPVTANDSV